MYVKVIQRFRDKEHKKRMRNVGDIFEVTEERLAELNDVGLGQLVEPWAEGGIDHGNGPDMTGTVPVTFQQAGDTPDEPPATQKAGSEPPAADTPEPAPPAEPAAPAAGRAKKQGGK